MTESAPDPALVRAASLEELHRLGLPLPPEQFPLVWDAGDQVELRPTLEIESRTAVLHLVLARCFGMPAELAMTWLLGGRLVDAVTPPEWQYVTAGRGHRRSFILHHDAVFALAWVLGLAKHLDPFTPPEPRLMDMLPNLPAGESFAQWRARTLAAPRDVVEVAALLDLYYCLDWAYLEAERSGLPVAGELTADAIGQRRWALEWVVVLRGPYHDAPPRWEEIDLTA